MSRLTGALDDLGGLPAGRVLVLHPRAGMDLSALSDLQIVQPFKPDHDAFARLGLPVGLAAEGEFAAALVCATRSKDETRGLIAQAASRAPLVLVDGQKTDGIESLLRDVRKRAAIDFVVSKAHGKLFAFEGGDFSDWVPKATEFAGFRTVPGVFSADGIDPGSAMLAEALPEKLPAKMGDLGAGWGYLARAVLQRPSVEQLHLVEADARALDLARENVSDPRAMFHWADAREATLPDRLGGIVMNPPFHQGRAADPGLGRAFIASAKRLLAPHGRLWCVANRHLPYEADLDASFAQVTEIGGDRRYKLLCAEKPRRTRR